MSAPDVSLPNSTNPSTLSTALGSPTPQMPQYSNADEQQTNTDLSGPQSNGGGGSRLARIMSAVANVTSAAMQGIPDKGRESVFTGAGEGARAQQAAQNLQQDIRFKTFDDQVRAAQLHHQDLELQMRTQEQQDAHQKFQDFQRDYDTDHGIDYNPVPNDGDAVIDHLKAQTAGNGAATIPAGTHLSADGTTIQVPTNTQATRDGQLQKYNTFAKVYGLPDLPEGAKFVPPKFMDALNHSLQGYNLDGTPVQHDNLPQKISTLQTQRDQLAKNGASADQLKALDSTIGILNANQKALDDHAASVKQQSAQSEEAGKIAAQNSPAGRSLAQSNEKLAEQKQDNAASDRQQKPQNTDSNGNPVWVPGVSADEKKKAELSENVVFNANNIASILARRPDIVGKVAGRMTTLDQMAGTNDPDITSLQQDMHNIAIANVGIHGMRANDAVHDVENNILNNFRNGPQAIGGALKSTANSVQTFIDNARPDTYKTHSKNGGAMRSMIPQQGQ
jgi:hypothetical protein